MAKKQEFKVTVEGEWTDEHTKRVMAITHRIALRVATQKAKEEGNRA